MGRVESGARNAAREAAPWVERLARLGYAAKGLVYLLIGGIAVRAALGKGGGVEGSSGALQALPDGTAGRVLLLAVALGLAGYALWGAVRAIQDPEGRGKSGAAHNLKRVGYGLSAALHLGLAAQALRLARGLGQSGGDGRQAQDWTAAAMDKPAGRWAVALVGAGIVAFGIYQLVRAAKEKVGEKLDLSSLSAGGREWVIRLGRAGLGARGVVFCIIGWFVLMAALHSNAGEARGLQGALTTLHGQPYGRWLLAIVGIGLAAYGAYELAQARWRRIRPA